MTQVRSFPVDRLNYKDSRELYDRINYQHDFVAPLAPESPPKRKYINVLVRFVKLTHRDALLLRLATSNSTRYLVRELHFALDGIAAELGALGGDPGMQWEEAWGRAVSEQRRLLVQLAMESNERMLVNEFRGDAKLEEALMTLWASLETNEPTDFLQFKREVYEQVRRFTEIAGPNMFDWYMPRQNVVIDRETRIGNGTFGDVWRGTLLLQNGEKQNVVIKQLYKHVTSDINSTELFTNQLGNWHNLMTNENISKTNILKLYGAVHIGDPQLYVCEDAVNGDLMTFLSNEENQSLFWLMFLQVAQGLKALHSQGMVHGGLKCTNILVAEGNVVKLSDFGFSFIRGLSIELSNHKNKAMTESVRWKPKEMLQETTMRSRT
ncbi:unnamed protein product [Phytophthora fragariaefolia]|uniref:Unnamed protein product n=1 Tax=Phytophthora fragariaefolia TaxID=1490495 RepID=A0A9W7D9T8_9STRA|nr:unnamed protein product [Phytophthora fragariaefolia]